MRLLLIALGIACSLKGVAQTASLTEVKLSIGDCRIQESRPGCFMDTIYFYQLPAYTLRQKIVPWRQRKFPVELKNIPAGTYEIRYYNNYAQKMTKQVTLTTNTTNLINLCPDVLQVYPQNILAKLQNHDSIVINIFLQSCWGNASRKMVIRKEREQFIAEWYELHSRTYMEKDSTNYRPNGKLLNVAILDSTGIAAFNRFENELEHLWDAHCTYTETYSITSKYWNVAKVDASCDWNGMNYLIKTFFKEATIVLKDPALPQKQL
jgi:hypothetical protein